MYGMSKRNRELIRLGMLQLLLFACVATFLAPTFWMLSSSLKASTEIFKIPVQWIPAEPRWQNYVDAFTRPGLPMWTFALNTFIVVFVAVLGTIFSSAITAFAFARLQWPGRRIFFGLMIATLMLPEIITLVPRFILFKNLGMINTSIGEGIFGDGLYFPWLPLTLPYWFATTGLYVFLIYQFFRGLPDELDEAAKMDGASMWTIFYQIMLPLSKPVLATVGVFALIQHYNDFLNPLIYLNKLDSYVLALGVRAFNDSNVQNWELVFAASTVMLLPVLLLFVVAQRFFIQGIALSGFGGR